MLNVEIIEGKNSPLTSNSYILKGLPKIQIDAGTTSNAKILVLTHCHFDHIYFAGEMQKNGCKIFASVETKKFVEKLSEETYANFVGLNAEIKIDVILKDGDVLSNDNFKLKVIETPGHCEGAICLWDEEGHFLFSGDTMFDMGVYGRTDLIGGDENKIKSSIKKLWALKPKVIFPGHGTVVYLD